MALLLLIAPFTANADLISFDFRGTCLVDCARLGLSDGDTFEEIGALVFADGTFPSAGTSLTVSDIVSFNLFGLDFLTGNQSDTDSVSFVADDVIGFVALVGGVNQFCYNVSGSTCAGGDFDTIVGESGIATGASGHGPAEFTRSVPVSVPEPGTLALLGIGLAGMGLARRRKAA